MKILHTSDWHLGRQFERESLREDQCAFIDWLVGFCRDNSVDLVLIAGDIYDRSVPPEDAVTLLDQTVDRLLAAGAEVCLISGNHDGPHRLGFGADRQGPQGYHVFYRSEGRPPWVFARNGEQVAIVAVPFLDPQQAGPPRPDPGGNPRARTHEAVLSDALDDGRAALAELGPMPSIAVAHAYVVGGEPSGSERTLSIGGTDQVAADVFHGFDYVALGHLHRPQVVLAAEGTDRPRIVYSGSPLPYSFSENHPKSVRVIDIAEGEIHSVEEIPVPVGRPVVTLRDSLENLLHDPRHEVHVGSFVAAQLTDETVQVQPLERLRHRFPHAVGVRYAPQGAGDGSRPTSPSPPEPRSPLENVLAFLSELRQQDANPAEEALVGDAVAHAGSGDHR